MAAILSPIGREARPSRLALSIVISKISRSAWSDRPVAVVSGGAGAAGPAPAPEPPVASSVACGLGSADRSPVPSPAHAVSSRMTAAAAPAGLFNARFKVGVSIVFVQHP
jgi:hypothetical protein